jgi:hypothetical protein
MLAIQNGRISAKSPFICGSWANIFNQTGEGIVRSYNLAAGGAGLALLPGGDN